MPESTLNLRIRKQNDVCIVEFLDRKILEEHTINQIGERLGEVMEDEAQPKLLLDFRNVEHLSSAALGMLITLNKQLGERQGRLVLANIHPQIYEVFKITRLNKHLNIQSSTEDAIKAFA
ncbi:MAG: STAS domain-containing protein [Phycisphaerae bacterium]|nr:STAS domain-containing protein [Phycisphaerae bacterium]